MSADPLALADVWHGQAAERIFSEYRHMSPEEWAALSAEEYARVEDDEQEF
jgi:hypothetical protein